MVVAAVAIACLWWGWTSESTDPIVEPLGEKTSRNEASVVDAVPTAALVANREPFSDAPSTVSEAQPTKPSTSEGHPVMGVLSPDVVAQLSDFGRFWWEHPEMDAGVAHSTWIVQELTTPEGKERHKKITHNANYNIPPLERVVDNPAYNPRRRQLSQEQQAELAGIYREHAERALDLSVEIQLLTHRAILDAIQIQHDRFEVGVEDLEDFQRRHGEAGPDLVIAGTGGGRLIPIHRKHYPELFAAKDIEKTLTDELLAAIRAYFDSL